MTHVSFLLSLYGAFGLKMKYKIAFTTSCFIYLISLILGWEEVCVVLGLVYIGCGVDIIINRKIENILPATKVTDRQSGPFRTIAKQFEPDAKQFEPEPKKLALVENQKNVEQKNKLVRILFSRYAKRCS